MAKCQRLFPVVTVLGVIAFTEQANAQLGGLNGGVGGMAGGAFGGTGGFGAPTVGGPHSIGGAAGGGFGSIGGFDSSLGGMRGLGGGLSGGAASRASGALDSRIERNTPPAGDTASPRRSLFGGRAASALAGEGAATGGAIGNAASSTGSAAGETQDAASGAQQVGGFGRPNASFSGSAGASAQAGFEGSSASASTPGANTAQ